MWKSIDQLFNPAHCCGMCLTSVKAAANMNLKLGGQLNKLFTISKYYRSTRTISDTSENLPVIRIPIKFQERIRKHQQKLIAGQIEKRKKMSQMGNVNKPIITCRNSELNYYDGQVLNKFEVVKLASQHWLNRKYDGDRFMINPQEKIHPAFANQEDHKPTFNQLNLIPELLKRLEEMNIETPSNIQLISIPPILQGFNTMSAAETGSGKTLAYLLPMVQNILRYKKSVDRSGIFNSPLGLILVPSRELVRQIYTVTLELTKSLPIHSAELVGGTKARRTMLNPPVQEMDILVATVGMLKKMVSSGIYSVSDVKHVVIDESDTLLDDSFSENILKFLKKIKLIKNVPMVAPPQNLADGAKGTGSWWDINWWPHERWPGWESKNQKDCTPSMTIDPKFGAQLTLIGATLPTDLQVILQDVIRIPSLLKLTTPHLHRIMNHVPQTFLRLKSSKKAVKLLELVKRDVKNKRTVMIFSKNSATSDFVSQFLNENGVHAINLNGRMSAFFRTGRLRQFQEGLCDVISCTDIASRGLDTARVKHIINYDFPVFISDYIHRVGRVGRLSSVGVGHVTSFVTNPQEVNLVQKVEIAARKLENLSEVNANIKGQILSKISALENSEFL